MVSNVIIDSDVSVALATYNGNRFIVRQIESLLSQSVLPSEIVVCDDRSKDGTVTLIKSFVERSPVPIRVIVNDINLGHAENFFKIVRSIKTRYISFCDQDDIWHRDKIALSMRALRESGALMAIHKALLIDSDDTVIGHMSHFSKPGVFPACTLDPWKSFPGLLQTVDKKIFEILPFDAVSRGQDSNNPQILLGHDSWTSFVAGTFGSIVAIDAELVSYRQHGINVYGFQNRNLMQKIKAKITEEQSRVERVRWLADIAQHRYQLINKLGSGEPHVDLGRAYWAKIARFCRLRRELVDSPNFFLRLYRLVECLAEGAYKPYSKRGLGSARLLEDAVMGVANFSLKKNNGLTE